MSANEGNSGSLEDDAHVYGYLLAMEDEGPGAKKIFGIGKNEVRIGRGSKNDIRLNARMFSRHHVTLTITKEDGIMKVNLQNMSDQKDATRAPYAILKGNSVTLDSPSVFLLQNRRFHWILNDGNKESVQSQCKEPISYITEGSQCSEDADENSLTTRNMVEYSPGTSKSRKSYSAPSPSRRRRSSANTGLELRKAAIKGSFRSQQQNRPSSSMSILREAMEKTDHGESSAQLSQSFDLITFSPESKADTSLPEAEKSDVSLIDLRSFVASPVLDEGEESQSQTSNEDELEIKRVTGSPKNIEDIPVVAGSELPVTEDVLTSLQIRTSITTPKRSTRSSASQGITNVVAEYSLLEGENVSESKQTATPKTLLPISKASEKTPLQQNEKADASIIGLSSFFATPLSQEKIGSQTPDQNLPQISTTLDSPVSNTSATPKRTTRSSMAKGTPEISLNISDKMNDSVNFGTPQKALSISEAREKTPLQQDEQCDVSNIGLRSFFATPRRSTRSSISQEIPNVSIDTSLLDTDEANYSLNAATPQKTSVPHLEASEGDESIIGLNSFFETPMAQEKRGSQTPVHNAPQIQTAVNLSVSSTSTTPKRLTRSSIATPLKASTPLPEASEGDESIIGLCSVFATPVAKGKEESQTPDQNLHIQTTANFSKSNGVGTPKRSTRSSISQEMVNMSTDPFLQDSVKVNDSMNISTPQKASSPLPEVSEDDVSIIGLRSIFATPVAQKKEEGQSPDQNDPQIPTAVYSRISTCSSATPRRSTRSSISHGMTNVSTDPSLLDSADANNSLNIAIPHKANAPLPEVNEGDESIIGLSSFFGTPLAQELRENRTPNHNVLHVQTTASLPMASGSATPKRLTRSSVATENSDIALIKSEKMNDTLNSGTPQKSLLISRASEKTPRQQDEQADVSLTGLRSFFATPRRSTRSSISQEMANVSTDTSVLDTDEANNSLAAAIATPQKSSAPHPEASEGDESIIGLNSFFGTPVAQGKEGSQAPDQNAPRIQTEVNLAVSSVSTTAKRSTRSTISQEMANVSTDTSLLDTDEAINSQNAATPQKASDPLPEVAEVDVSIIGLRSIFATPVAQGKEETQTPHENDPLNSTVSSISTTPKRSTRSMISQRNANVSTDTSLLDSNTTNNSLCIATPQKANAPLPKVSEVDVSIIGLRSIFATPVAHEKDGNQTPDTNDPQIQTAVYSPISTSTSATPKRSTRSSVAKGNPDISLLNSDKMNDTVNFGTPKKVLSISNASEKSPLRQDEQADVSLTGLRSFFETPIRSTRSSISQEIPNVSTDTSILHTDEVNNSLNAATPQKTSVPHLEASEGDESIIGLNSFFETPVAQKKGGSQTPVYNAPQIQTAVNLSVSSTSATPKRLTRSSMATEKSDISVLNSDKMSDSLNIISPLIPPPISKESTKTPVPQNENAEVSIIGLRSIFATPMTEENDKIKSQNLTTIDSPVSNTSATPKRSTRSSMAKGNPDVSLLNSDNMNDSLNVGTPQKAPSVSKSSEKTPHWQDEQADISITGLRSFFTTPRSTRSSISQEMANVSTDTSLLNTDEANNSLTAATPRKASGSLQEASEGDESVIGLSSFFGTPVAQEIGGSRKPVQNDPEILTAVYSAICSSTSTSPRRSTPPISQEMANVSTDGSLLESKEVINAPEITEVKKSSTPVEAAKKLRTLGTHAVTKVEETPTSAKALKKSRSRRAPAVTEVEEAPIPEATAKKSRTRRAPAVKEMKEAPTLVEKAQTLVEKDPTPVEKDPTPVEKDPTPVEKDPTPVEKDPTPVEKDPTPANIAKKSRTRRLPEVTEVEKAPTLVELVKKSRTRRAPAVTKMKEAKTPVEVAKKSRTRRVPVDTEVEEPTTSVEVVKKSRTRRAPVVTEVEEAPIPAEVVKKSRTRRAPTVTEVEDAPTPVEVAKKSRTRRAPTVTEVEDAPTPVEVAKKSRTQRAPTVTEVEDAPTPVEVAKKSRTRRAPTVTEVEDAPTPVEVAKKSRTRRAPTVTEVEDAPTPVEVAKKSRTRRAPTVTEVEDAPTPVEVAKKSRTRRAPTVTEVEDAPTPVEVAKKSRTRRAPAVTEVEGAPIPVEVAKKSRTRRAPTVTEVEDAPTPVEVAKKSRTRRAPAVTEVEDAPTLVEVAKKSRTRRAPTVTEVEDAPTPVEVAKKSRTRRAPAVTEVEGAPIPVEVAKKSRTRRAPTVTEVEDAPTPVEVAKKSRTRRAPAVTEVEDAPTLVEVAKKSRTQCAPEVTEEAPVKEAKKPRTRRGRSVTVVEDAPTPVEIVKKSRTRRAPAVTEVEEAPTPAEVVKKSRTRRAPAVTEVEEAPTPVEIVKKSRTRRAPVIMEEVPVVAAKIPKTRRGRAVTEVEDAPTPAKVSKKFRTQLTVVPMEVAKKSRTRRAH